MFKKTQILIAGTLLLSASASSFALSCNNENTEVAATTDHLQISSDGQTVYDPKTDLTWQRCSVGQSWDNATCVDDPSAMTWQEALSTAESVGDNWRLPNIKELGSIVEERCWGPAINTEAFPNTSNLWYWSSSPSSASNKRTAWIVYFYSGSSSSFSHGGNTLASKIGELAIRLVRSGE